MSDIDFKRIGKKIKEKRLSLGFRQEYMAEKLNVNPSHISNIECGRAHPSLTILMEIANIHRCSVDYFLNEEYTFETEPSDNLDQMIMRLIQIKNDETKYKILKILEIL